MLVTFVQSESFYQYHVKVAIELPISDIRQFTSASPAFAI